MNNGFLKLHKIIKCSSKVQRIRENLGLIEGEFLVGPIENYVKTTKGKSISRNNFFKALKKLDEIQRYFDLDPQINLSNRVFWGDPTLTPYMFVPRIKEGKVHFTIIFDEIPSKEAFDGLVNRMKRYLELGKACNDKTGFKTKKNEYERIKTVTHFDEKYELSKEYEELKKKYKRIPKSEMNALVKKSSGLLKKNNYTAKDLRKDIDQFNEYLAG